MTRLFGNDRLAIYPAVLMMRAPMNPGAEPWNLDQAREMYHIDRWGAGYYDINAKGRVVAKPLPNDKTAVELSAVIDAAKTRDLDLSLIHISEPTRPY